MSQGYINPAKMQKKMDAARAAKKAAADAQPPRYGRAQNKSWHTHPHARAGGGLSTANSTTALVWSGSACF